MMSVEQSVECLARETEVLGENLPQSHLLLLLLLLQNVWQTD
jgi:hypothetical protein